MEDEQKNKKSIEVQRALQLLLGKKAEPLVFQLQAKHISDYEIHTTFRVSDDVVYKWTIYNPNHLHARYNIKFFLSTIGGAIVSGFGIGFLPFWLLSLLNKSLAFYTALVAFFIFVILFIYNHLAVLIGPEIKKRLLKKNLVLFSIIPAMTLLFLMSLPISNMRNGFSGNTSSFAQWLLFTADSIVDIVLFGIPGSLGVKWSDIEPIARHTQLAKQLFQIFVAVGVIELILLMYKLSFGKNEFYGTVLEAIAECHTLPRFPGQLRREGRIEEMERPEAVQVPNFRKAMPMFDPNTLKWVAEKRVEQYINKYQEIALIKGGGSPKGAANWLYKHRPSRWFGSKLKQMAWVRTIEAFEESV